MEWAMLIRDRAVVSKAKEGVTKEEAPLLLLLLLLLLLSCQRGDIRRALWVWWLRTTKTTPVTLRLRQRSLFVVGVPFFSLGTTPNSNCGNKSITNSFVAVGDTLALFPVPISSRVRFLPATLGRFDAAATATSLVDLPVRNTVSRRSERDIEAGVDVVAADGPSFLVVVVVVVVVDTEKEEDGKMLSKGLPRTSSSLLSLPLAFLFWDEDGTTTPVIEATLSFQRLIRFPESTPKTPEGCRALPLLHPSPGSVSERPFFPSLGIDISKGNRTDAIGVARKPQP